VRGQREWNESECSFVIAPRRTCSSHPPQALKSGSHPLTSTTPPLVSLAARASNHLTNGEAALLLRLHNLQVPLGDISLMAAMRGHTEFTTDEVQVLWRPQNLNLPMEDINLIVDTVRRGRRQNAAVGHNNTTRTTGRKEA
jgi:hypothetical protein